MPNEINTTDGFIKLHRKILNWEWYDNANTMRVFLHCLLSANHKDNNWHGILVKQGSFITSVGKLANSLNLTNQQIRTSLNKLKLTNEITIKTTSQYTVIAIKNWNEYQQNNKQTNNQITNEQQTNNKRITINKNDKNENNEKNEKNILLDNNEKKSSYFVKPTIEEIQDYCLERNNGINAEYFYTYYEARGWLIGKSKMKSWKACIRTWEIKSKEDKIKPKSNKLTDIVKSVMEDENE